MKDHSIVRDPPMNCLDSHFAPARAIARAPAPDIGACELQSTDPIFADGFD